MHRGEHRDACGEQTRNLFQTRPAVGFRCSNVVDTDDLRVAGKDRVNVQVHLRRPVSAGAQYLEVAQLMPRIAMHAIRGYDHVCSAAASAPAFVEQRRRRAAAPGVAEIRAKQDAAPCLGRDAAQHLQGIWSRVVATAHLANLAMTWMSESGSRSMM